MGPRRISIDRVVAVKVVNHSGDEVVVERFSDLSSRASPTTHVVTIHDFGMTRMASSSSPWSSCWRKPGARLEAASHCPAGHDLGIRSIRASMPHPPESAAGL